MKKFRSMSVVMDVIYFFIVVSSLPYFFLRMIWEKGYWKKIVSKFRSPPIRRGKRPCIWVHAVSVGEVLSIQNFVPALERELPQYEVVLSTFTTTGQEVARKIFPNHFIFNYPLDLSRFVRLAFHRIRPRLVILVELELWPNFLYLAAQFGIPVMVINGRITQKSKRGYQRLKFFFHRPLQHICHYCVQTKEYGERFQQLGVSPQKISVVGNIKFDNVFVGNVSKLQRQMQRNLGLPSEALVIVAGSVHPREEEIVLDIYCHYKRFYDQLFLILAPRHPQKIPQMVSALQRRSLKYLLKTDLDRQSQKKLRPNQVLLVDTMGELPYIYAVASLVFVGGSFIPYGGHNVLEPAVLGKPVLVGPHTFNFRKIVEYLASFQGIIQVRKPSQLREWIGIFLRSYQKREEIGRNARSAILRNRGATEKTVALVSELVRNLDRGQ
ncbi:MAG: 3-deoxy-D-manno-octulosonic acid transferase [Planctomycetota bacterium]|nr:MAG: 3-deoxy-D-manno-octulosonic acid transferase [Planctomycetota bacterium]